MPEWPILRTHLARQEWGEYRFRGHRVFEQLAGRTGFWRMLSLALGGPELSDEDCAVLNDLTDSSTAADPRIPALKIGRILAAYGSEMTALATIFLPLEGGLFGPWSVLPAARMLVEVRAQVGDDWTHEALLACIQDRFERGVRVHGFGVPARTYDERVWSMDKSLERRGRNERPYWRLMRGLDKVLTDLKGWGANLSTGYGAVFLDLGFGVEHTPLMGVAAVLPCIAGNVHEGAREAPEVLRRIPDEWLDYQGPPPRQSPRATAKR